MMQAGMEIPQLRPNRQRLTHAPVELHCNSSAAYSQGPSEFVHASACPHCLNRCFYHGRRLSLVNTFVRPAIAKATKNVFGA